MCVLLANMPIAVILVGYALILTYAYLTFGISD